MLLYVVYASCRKQALYDERRYADCHYADCHYAERHNAKCHYDECHCAECHNAEHHNTECHYSECHCAECHYAECHYADCRGALTPPPHTNEHRRTVCYCLLSVFSIVSFVIVTIAFFFLSASSQKVKLSSIKLLFMAGTGKRTNLQNWGRIYDIFFVTFE